MQALATGHSGFAGPSRCFFGKRNFKQPVEPTLSKNGCTSDAEASDVQLSSPQPARRSALAREFCGLGVNQIARTAKGEGFHHRLIEKIVRETELDLACFIERLYLLG